MSEGPSSPEQILATCRSALLVDWPSREVPATLARAGWAVHVKGGPGADDFSVWEIVDGAPVSRATRRRPAQIDLVYVYRPLEELPAIIDMARAVGARALWYESGSPSRSSARARSLVEGAGLAFVGDRDIVDAVRAA